MKTTRFLILSALAVGTLGLSSCVVDESYPVERRYAYVERSNYRDNHYGHRRYRNYNYDRYDNDRYDGHYRHGRVGGLRGEIHGTRADIHNAIFH